MIIKDFLSRIGKMRGFGIQSPWAYDMVREVIAERLPYYHYAVIDEQMKDETPRKRKLAKLYYRLENRIKPCGGKMRIIAFADVSDDFILKEISDATEDSVVILEGINADSSAKMRWERLHCDNALGVVFDLRDTALCFVKRKMYPQFYKLLF